MLAQSLQGSKHIGNLLWAEHGTERRHHGVGVDLARIYHPLAQLRGAVARSHAVQRGGKGALDACFFALLIGDGMAGGAVARALVEEDAPALLWGCYGCGGSGVVGGCCWYWCASCEQC
jgi:hypothetical protein